MVIEDELDIREEVVDFLRDEGYEVLVAHNGKEALSLLRAGVAPCVILLDLMMPVMDGWTFRKEQMNDPALANIPVVVLSGVQDIAKAVAQLAPAACLAKPFKIERLLETVKAHC
jgi:CheY-like chemotaxis protein